MSYRHVTHRTVVGSVLTGVLLVAVACGSDGTPSEAAVAPRRTGHATAAANEIVMKLIAYQPDELDVPVGTTVTWTQADAGYHTVTSGTVKKDASGSVETEPNDTFASGQLAKGKTFTFAFDQAGTYPYFCEIHPATMSGRVSVA